jgi:ABC-2 type transport system permease protein
MMRFLPAGSALWLLAHEMRMGLRGMAPQTFDGKMAEKGASQIALIGLAIFGVAVIAIGGIGLGFLAGRFPLPQSPLVALIVTGGSLGLFTLMLSQAINMSVQALFERRDLDLLLSSPIRPRVVLTVRAVSIALVVVLLYAALGTPFVLTASLLGRPEWLGLHVLLVAMAMVATAFGIMLTLALFAAIGPRATRTLAQILAGVTGGIAFLASQMWNLTRPADKDNGPGPLYASLQGLLDTGLFEAGQPLSWPVQALTGDLMALAALGGIALAGFAAVSIGLAPRFSVSVTEAAGSTSSAPAGAGADKPFAEGLTRVMIRKELRLLARDPQLVSQAVLRLIYLLPLGFIVIREPDSGAQVAFSGAGIVVMAGQLAGSFAWIIISAEDSPDLLGCAPIDRAVADRAKLMAALVPTLALTALVLAGLAFVSPLAAVVVLAGCVCSAASSGLIQLWQQRPEKRKAFNQNKYGSILIRFAEFIIQALWASATGMAIAGLSWALIPAALAVGATALMRRPDIAAMHQSEQC